MSTRERLADLRVTKAAPHFLGFSRFLCIFAEVFSYSFSLTHVHAQALKVIIMCAYIVGWMYRYVGGFCSSICLSIYVYIHQSVCLSIFTDLSIHPCIYLPLPRHGETNRVTGRQIASKQIHTLPPPSLHTTHFLIDILFSHINYKTMTIKFLSYVMCSFSQNFSFMCSPHLVHEKRHRNTKKNKYNYTPINYYKTEL